MKIKHETSAGGIVYKKVKDLRSKILDLKWLICQHSQHKGWVFPKGLMGDKDSQELMEEAALREVKEEGGVKAKIINRYPIEVQYQYRFKEFLVKKTVYYFLMEYISGDPNDHDWEMLRAKFISQSEVNKTLTYKSDQQAFEKALDFMN